MDSSLVAELSSIFAPYIVGAVALITYLFFRYQHQANGLLEAFKVLNTEQHRAARSKVYQTHKSYLKARI